MPFKPNLPNKKVSKVYMSAQFPNFCRELNLLGITTVNTSDIAGFLPFEAMHADMQFLPIDEDCAFILSTAADVLPEDIKKLYKTFTEIPVPDNTGYPNNVLLNIAVINQKAFGLKKAVPQAVLDEMSVRNMEFIDVNQGYAKCSAAVVADNAVITADVSIYNACKSEGIDVLKISAGNIILPKCNYGFIGGCCGKISQDTLAFSGNIKLHPDYRNIKDFCKNYNTDLLSLSNEPIIDIGGIIPIN